MVFCKHNNVFFDDKKKTFKCSNCGKGLIKVASMLEFELFCMFVGIDRKILLRQ